MSEDTRTPAQRAKDETEREIFGDDPVRNPDGSPMERGHGSPYAGMPPAAKAHFHAVQAHAAVDEVISISKQLIAATQKLAALNEEAVKATHASKVAPPLKPVVDEESQTASEVAARARASDAELLAEDEAATRPRRSRPQSWPAGRMDD